MSDALNTSKVEGLALYQYATCPFCMRVRDAIHRLGIEIELRDTDRNPAYGEELIRQSTSLS